MIGYPWLALKTSLLTGLDLFRSLPAEGWNQCWKRLPLFVLMWLAFVLLSLQHLIGFLLDEIFFPGYRAVRVDRPVFILGIPRSGTTFLHRILAADGHFTTLSTWEVFFAPSITERYFYRFISAVLRPVGKLAGALRHRLFRHMDTVHVIALQHPEEDFILLAWIRACFPMAFVCPGRDHYWRLARFDAALEEREKRRILRFYRRCLQKHLFYHGTGHFLLSKNPSFTACLDSLRETFPDARFIACLRTPEEAVPSQLSALRPAMRLLGNGELRPGVQAAMIEVLHHYYAVLSRQHDDERLVTLANSLLRGSLQQVLERLYAFLELAMDDDFRDLVARTSEQSRQYESPHRYDAGEFSLTRQGIEARFRDVWPVRHRNSLEVA